MRRLVRRLSALPLTLRWSAVGALAAVALWGVLVTVAVVVTVVTAVADGEILAWLESGVQGVAAAVVMTIAVGAIGGTLGLVIGLVDRVLGRAVVRNASARRPALVASLVMAGFLVVCAAVLLRLTASGSGPLGWVVLTLVVVTVPLVVCVRRYRRLESPPSHSSGPRLAGRRGRRVARTGVGFDSARWVIHRRSLDRCEEVMPRAGARCIRRSGHPGVHRASP